MHVVVDLDTLIMLLFYLKVLLFLLFHLSVVVPLGSVVTALRRVVVTPT